MDILVAYCFSEQLLPVGGFPYFLIHIRQRSSEGLGTCGLLCCGWRDIFGGVNVGDNNSPFLKPYYHQGQCGEKKHCHSLVIYTHEDVMREDTEAAMASKDGEIHR